MGFPIFRALKQFSVSTLYFLLGILPFPFTALVRTFLAEYVNIYKRLLKWSYIRSVVRCRIYRLKEEVKTSAGLPTEKKKGGISERIENGSVLRTSVAENTGKDSNK